jgi:outer membrane protein
MKSRKIKLSPAWVLVLILFVPAAFPGHPVLAGQLFDPATELSAGKRLSLADAIKLALTSSESIKTAGLDEKIAAAQITQARSAIMPQLSAQASFVRNKNELTEADIAFLSMGSGFGYGRYTSVYSGGLRLSQTLYSGGSLKAGIKMAAASRDMARNYSRLSKAVTIARIARIYYGVLLAEETLRVRRASLQLAGDHYREVLLRKAAKTVSKFEVLRAKVAMQNQEAVMISDELRLRESQAALLRHIGKPLNAKMVLTTGFADQQAVPDFKKSESMAFIKRPELAAAKSMVRGSRAGIKYARSGYLPTLSSFAEWGGLAYSSPFKDDNFTDKAAIGLELRWNLFDGLNTRGRMAEAGSLLARSQWEERMAARDISLEVRQALLRMDSAVKLTRTQRANVSEAEESLKLANVRHKAGASTELVVQDARNQLEVARLNEAISLFHYSVARIDLIWATGSLESANWSEEPLRTISADKNVKPIGKAAGAN